MQGAGGSFAQVIVPSPLKEPLTYKVPPHIRDALRAGMRVAVPMGKRKVTGVVVDFCSETQIQQVKEILAILDERPVVDGSLLSLIHWIAQYYLAPIGEVLAAVLPASLRSESRRIIIARPGEFPDAGARQREILAEVRRRKSVRGNSLARKFPGGGFYRALEGLAAMGAVEIREQPISHSRKKMWGALSNPSLPPPDSRPVSLTSEQQGAVGVIGERLHRGGFEAFLLYGVTASGKTEVYLRAVELARKARRRSLILVPEISLTPQLLDRLYERFPDRVGVLHSALTPSQRWAQWWQILAGNADVVVGARSAVFAPVPDLGLIIVDEEHDTSYKQEEGLRYHGRDVAVVRAKLLDCPVVLGSATPAVESFENCRRGRYRLLELTQRVERRSLPPVEVIDLKTAHAAKLDPSMNSGSTLRKVERVDPRNPKLATLFSPRLREALQDNLSRGQQSLIFLNRRGFANFLQCPLCGFVLRCDHCSVSMTFHRKQGSVICHHCGARRAARDLCPGCGHLSLLPMGSGTEQIEQELARLLPQARIARMDRDTTRKRGAQERLIRQWEKGEIDVLVGTQMITKGHDVSGVTLVGALLADLSLNLPDFRAAERTFQLLSQVAGRAGRGDEPGRVIIQTYAPDHYAVEHVLNHDYKGFFAAELEFRRALSYPPFSRLILLRLEGTKAQEVEDKAKMLGDWLRRQPRRQPTTDPETEILGPAPAPIAKLRGRYRWQILLKGKKGASLSHLASQAPAVVGRSSRMRLHIDVDPYNML